jgi:hypothetical protein
MVYQSPGLVGSIEERQTPRITLHMGKRGDRGVLVGIPSVAMIKCWVSPTHARRLGT